MFEGLFQPTHLIIILVLVLIVFGAGKLPDAAGGFGRGIREFKKSLTDDDDAEATTAASAAPSQVAPTTPIASTSTSASATPTCATCGAPIPNGAHFCANCGSKVAA